jgi:hypothetical protein
MNTCMHPCLALTVGTGLGMLLAIGGQKIINQHQSTHCPQKTDHQLVMITSFLGDTYYCIHKRDL